MELELKRDTLQFERLVTQGEEQVSIEGEATLPGSMRDAVTVLSVQAQVCLNGAQAGAGEAAVRGRVSFQVLYTQGDLTKIRALETTCDFDHTLPLAGVLPGMRVNAVAAVQETQGQAMSGRMTLRALLGVQVEAFECAQKELVTAARQTGDPADSLQTRSQSVAFCCAQDLGEGKTLVREEFDLPAKLEVGDVLSATGTASAGELTGGGGRVGVSGVIEVRVLHRPQEAGNPLVVTTHELPYEIVLDAQLPEGAQPRAIAEVVDVMADSAATDKRRTLRVEAEVRVTLRLCRQGEMELLEDLYSLSGPELVPVRERLDLHTFEESASARESTRLQIALPQEAPPVQTMLATFVQPTLTALTPAGRRLDAEGLMSVTLIYLPVDSDIPYAIHAREPFAMTFPIEAGEGVRGRLYAIESTAGPTTSDRAEVRCVLGLDTMQHGIRHVDAITDVEQRPAAAQDHGFVLVWPTAGESRWQTARRLRVAEGSLIPAGKNALLAFRR